MGMRLLNRKSFSCALIMTNCNSHACLRPRHTHSSGQSKYYSEEKPKGGACSLGMDTSLEVAQLRQEVSLLAPTGEGAPHSGRASRRSREAGLRTAAAAATQRAEVAQGQGVGPQGELLFDAKRRRLLLVAAAHVRKRGQLGAIAPGRTVVVYIRRFT